MKDLTCGVYDYFVSIYSQGTPEVITFVIQLGYSFKDTEARIEIIAEERTALGDQKKVISVSHPSDSWTNASSSLSSGLYWHAYRIHVNMTGEVKLIK